MSTFEHDGETFWYDAVSSGPALLVLHGGLGLDHTYLRPGFDQLASELQVVYLDLRANGRSTGDGAGMTMAQLAADVDALRAHLGLDRMALFGHSYGGFVALQYALTFPDRLTHLLLCDTDTHGPTEAAMVAGLHRLGLEPEILGAFAAPVTSTEDLIDVFAAVEPAYLPHSTPGSASRRLRDVIYRQEGSDGGDHALAGWDVTHRLPEFEAPTLVLGGIDDFMFSADRSREIARSVPAGTHHVFQSSGHLPHLEEPGPFMETVREFLSRPGSDARAL